MAGLLDAIFNGGGMVSDETDGNGALLADLLKRLEAGQAQQGSLALGSGISGGPCRNGLPGTVERTGRAGGMAHGHVGREQHPPARWLATACSCAAPWGGRAWTGLQPARQGTGRRARNWKRRQRGASFMRRHWLSGGPA